MTFQELLRTELPIIQAPMAGAQGSALAIAVSNAGGRAKRLRLQRSFGGDADPRARAGLS
jgi:NAD(P)H-dependent flavin oxidoreductase YrpB (nitropropane dioxygenase family)